MTRDERIEIIARAALAAVPLSDSYMPEARECAANFLDGIRAGAPDAIEERMEAGMREAARKIGVAQ